MKLDHVSADLFVCPICGEVRRSRGQASMLCPEVATRHGKLRVDDVKAGTTARSLATGQAVPMVLVAAAWRMPAGPATPSPSTPPTP